MHGRIDSTCPGVNVGSIARRYVFHDKWIWIQYSIISKTPGIDVRKKECTEFKDDVLGIDKYQPYDIFSLPPTRPYTIPENEYP